MANFKLHSTYDLPGSTNFLCLLQISGFRQRQRFSTIIDDHTANSRWPAPIFFALVTIPSTMYNMEVGFIIVKVSKKSSKKFSKKYSKKYSTFWVLFWVLKKVLKKVLLLNIAQKSAQKSAQKRDKLLKWDKFAQKSAKKSQIYSFLSRVLKKVL